VIITIDGPTASGKSSVAFQLAHQLKFYCLSSGLLYRALACVLLHDYQYSLEDLQQIDQEDIKKALEKIEYILEEKGCGTLYYEGKPLKNLKSDLVSQGSSIIATNAFVRSALKALQRSLAQNKNMVIEGRDAGSVVFKTADIKFYLTASIEARAQRWRQVQEKRGEIISLQDAKKHIQERDMRDQERAIDPLVIPHGAVIIDNSAMNLAQTLDAMMEYIKKR
jgi:cytidylate kinase